MDKARFVVVEEHTLGCIRPVQPDTIQVLHTSVLRGSPYAGNAGMIGTIPVPLNPARMRPATRQDFEDYRVSTAGYERDPRCDFPAE